MIFTRRDFLRGLALSPLCAGPLSALAEGEGPVPLIFDTDIGTDIDDALTVVYLQGQKRCELLGITTAFGDTVERARLVSAILMAAGREVPIHPGSSQTISGMAAPGMVPEARVLAKWPHRNDFEPESAVEFMYETIRGRPHEVTLLATGPLTNVARLFQRHPDSAMLLKSVTLMNGSFRIMFPEYNMVLDRKASRIVYETKLPELYVVDYETGLQAQMGKEEARRRIRGGAFAPVADMLEIFFELFNEVTFFDSMAAASIFEPGLVEFKPTNVKVRLARTWASRSPGPHMVSVDVDEARFKEHYFSTTAGV